MIGESADVLNPEGDVQSSHKFGLELSSLVCGYDVRDSETGDSIRHECSGDGVSTLVVDGPRFGSTRKTIDEGEQVLGVVRRW